MDTSSSDAARLLRLLGVRALVLALFAVIVGATLPAAVFALTGVCLLLVRVESAADRRLDPDQGAAGEITRGLQSTSSSTSAETGSNRTGRLLMPVRRLE
ncbi:MAG TPA: hypothetical protein VIU15_28520 [Streptomyces sp.]